MIAVSAYMIGREGGKSGLHRAGYSVTRSKGDLKESATENTQPTRLQESAAMVKRRGKSSPVLLVTAVAW